MLHYPGYTKGKGKSYRLGPPLHQKQTEKLDLTAILVPMPDPDMF